LKNSDEKIICFVELKGNDINKAIDQVTNTYRCFGRKIQRMKLKNSKGLIESITCKAYIRLGGSAPIKIKDDEIEPLRKAFNGKKNIKISRDKDVGSFIRGL
jgi:hypothetical protein